MGVKELPVLGKDFDDLDIGGFRKYMKVSIMVFAMQNKGEPFMIYTSEGAMIVEQDDWIIKEDDGVYYPCKPSIFEKTYKPAFVDYEKEKRRFADRLADFSEMATVAYRDTRGISSCSKSAWIKLQKIYDEIKLMLLQS